MNWMTLQRSDWTVHLSDRHISTAAGVRLPVPARDLDAGYDDLRLPYQISR